MNSAKNVMLEWVRRHVGPTYRRLMRRAPASRLGPMLVWIEFVHEINPMRPEWQQILMAREIVPQTVPPRLPVWTIPKLYSQACLVNWNYLHTSFSSQMIRFLVRNMWHLTLFPHPFFFCLSSFFVISCHFIFCSPENVSCDKYYHRCKKLNSKACIHVKFSSCTIWKVSYQKTYEYTKNFLWAGVLPPHRLFNLCKALSKCFYTRVLLGSSECFYWVPERCFVIQCDLGTNPLFRQIMCHVTDVILQGKYTCKHSDVAVALR
jgi:hypothetical protein